MTREGINYSIQITAITKYDSSVIEATKDVYNTFDDMVLFYMERNDYELISQIPTEVLFHKGVLTIEDERDVNCTFTYKLVLL